MKYKILIFLLVLLLLSFALYHFIKVNEMKEIIAENINIATLEESDNSEDNLNIEKDSTKKSDLKVNGGDNFQDDLSVVAENSNYYVKTSYLNIEANDIPVNGWKQLSEKISFPQIYFKDDNDETTKYDKITKLNEMIFYSIIKYYESLGLEILEEHKLHMPIETIIEGKVTYLSDDIISVLYDTYFNNITRSYFRNYGSTININDETFITLNELIGSNVDLIDMYNNNLIYITPNIEFYLGNISEEVVDGTNENYIYPHLDKLSYDLQNNNPIEDGFYMNEKGIVFFIKLTDMVTIELLYEIEL